MASTATAARICARSPRAANVDIRALGIAHRITMKRLFAVVAIFAISLLFPCLARAEDSPPPDKPVPQQQTPDKPAQDQGEAALKDRREAES